MAIAHTANAEGRRHSLVDHLEGVAERSSKFAGKLGAGEAGYYLGLWHDLGKFHPDFQQYLLECEAEGERRRRGPDHKAAGTVVAEKHLGPVSLAIQGHHGGLSSAAEFKTWLSSKRDEQIELALRLAKDAMRQLEPDEPMGLPAHVETDPISAEMFVRLMFSALVDADYLDTERHFRVEDADARSQAVPLYDLRARLEEYVDELSQKGEGQVAEARRRVHKACVKAASGPTGFYRLTAPTGAGKTLAAMSFALKHATEHDLERVVVAVPFISITEQTADVYRKVFEQMASVPVVLEHHSAVTGHEDDEAFGKHQVWSRLAAENWDAPIVVTTTVQLFESLFSNLPSRCRKLHRLARSVIIIDEAQALPAHLLQPILAALRELCREYGSTALISTATQPAFEAISPFSDMEGTDIIPDARELFARLSRVSYEWRVDEVVNWEEAAHILGEHPQGLAVLNTRADALALLDALGDSAALHLSTLLCGAHRRNTINEVKRRLAAGETCRLVSTQVIEAGVDVDFPFVMRAIGPLDGVIQAAGRCNREGSIAKGTVLVFRPAEGSSPSKPYRTGIGITRALLGKGSVDPNDPQVAREYFRQLFESVDTDRERIQDLRKSLDYPEVARRFTMIDENTTGVVITQYGTSEERARVRSLVDELRRGTPRSRLLLRRLQPYVVSVRRDLAERYEREGLIRGIGAGLGEWLGNYDGVRGLGKPGLDAESLVV